MPGPKTQQSRPETCALSKSELLPHMLLLNKWPCLRRPLWWRAERVSGSLTRTLKLGGQGASADISTGLGPKRLGWPEEVVIESNRGVRRQCGHNPLRRGKRSVNATKREMVNHLASTRIWLRTICNHQQTHGSSEGRSAIRRSQFGADIRARTSAAAMQQVRLPIRLWHTDKCGCARITWPPPESGFLQDAPMGKLMAQVSAVRRFVVPESALKIRTRTSAAAIRPLWDERSCDRCVNDSASPEHGHQGPQTLRHEPRRFPPLSGSARGDKRHGLAAARVHVAHRGRHPQAAREGRRERLGEGEADGLLPWIRRAAPGRPLAFSVCAGRNGGRQSGGSTSSGLAACHAAEALEEQAT